MSLSSNYTTPFKLRPSPNPLLFPQSPLQIREFRVFRRRRLKTQHYHHHHHHHHLNLTLRYSFNSFENLFNSLLSQVPSANSLEIVAPALGFASGVAIYLSKLHSANNSMFSDIGEWILFTSPTPFNRFVFLRCPSISFPGSELLEGVNEKLVKEERHYVRLNRGRIQAINAEARSDSALEENLVYQRVCVSTDDGGVISLDWPASLDLKGEHGLDTTLLLVPGTPEGSMDKNIRSFVCEALKRGFFPVVMNPRGCAGSPLTTARLFTAADSDDICTSIQFIKIARPSTTLMGVSWGYGANMLTKYLAEVGEGTPLTAATCIDNPFDLEEATRSSPHHLAIDQKLTVGLIDILRSNKELFHGRTKGFDVKKGLSATSIREFEKAISMVSYGFESVEDFYSKSSTRGVIGNVKVPVLYVQNDDGAAPLFSIPRGLIAKNPFTSLLLCSYSPSSIIAGEQSALSWCKNVAIEWLTAVELGLLKGRHPLLKDVDVTINPSEGLALMEGRASDKTGKVNKHLELGWKKYSTSPLTNVLEESDKAASIYLRSRKDLERKLELEGKGFQVVEDSGLRQTSSVDAELVKEEEVSSEDIDRGQVLRTAQVVMNMLDISVPGTLTEEKKKKVLNAIDQGETLMNALQNAVPEDVRGKLAAAVSGIMHTQGKNFKVKELLPDTSSTLKTKSQDKGWGVIPVEGFSQVQHSSFQTRVSELVDGSDNYQPEVDKLSREPQSSYKSQKSIDHDRSQAPGSPDGDLSSSIKETGKSGIDGNDEPPNENASPIVDYSEKESEASSEPKISSQAEQIGNSDASIDNEHKEWERGTSQLDEQENKLTKKHEENAMESSSDQNKVTSLGKTEEEALATSGSSSEAEPLERVGHDDQKKDIKNAQPVVDQNKSMTSDSSASPFGVSQALDALTGMDDSTQAAVNSVFNVLENMISQLEEGSENDEVENKKIDSALGNQQPDDSQLMEKNEDYEIDLSMQPDRLIDPLINNDTEEKVDSQLDATNGWPEKEPCQSRHLSNGSCMDRSQAATDTGKKENEKKDQLVGRKHLTNNLDNHSDINIALYMTSNPYRGSVYSGHLWDHLLDVPSESLDMDTTAALLLDYIPEEGQWKLIENPENGSSADSVSTSGGLDMESRVYSPAKVNYTPEQETPYIIWDNENQHKPIGEFETMNHKNEMVEVDDRSQELGNFVKNIIMNSLKVEVGRRLNAANKKKLEPNLTRELEHVANTLSLAVRHEMEHNQWVEFEYYSMDSSTDKVGTLRGENIIRAISSAVQETSYLRKVLPFGVIVGSSLAALRKFFHVATVHDVSDAEAPTLDQGKGSMGGPQMPTEKDDLNASLNDKVVGGRKPELKTSNKGRVMVGAVTAAIGASALLVQHRDSYGPNQMAESSSKSFKLKGNYEELGRLEDTSSKNQNNIVTSLAEKAISVASPVVPTKEDGEVDQERLVAMLADLGQKGGALRLVGKLALLWGGLRGAMSLTDRLISFLHIAERPLFQRILGFAGMVLVLWSPVAIPLLPTLVQSWTANTPARMAEFACVIGLYAAVMMLITIWGKRIRCYKNPLKRYGLDLTSLPKIYNFLKALLGGIMLVIGIQFINTLIGCTSLSWPASSSVDIRSWLKTYGKILMLTCQGILMATVVTIVEELLFRSWLFKEIAEDLGYHQGIIISGLAFSLFQRSLQAIPGMWLLSLALAGARQRSEGSLAIPIGLRAGIMASSFVIQKGGFMTYKPNFPIWVTGTHPFQPLSGVVGFAFSLILACILYPRRPLKRKHLKRNIRE